MKEMRHRYHAYKLWQMAKLAPIKMTGEGNHRFGLRLDCGSAGAVYLTRQQAEASGEGAHAFARAAMSIFAFVLGLG